MTEIFIKIRVTKNIALMKDQVFANRVQIPDYFDQKKKDMYRFTLKVYCNGYYDNDNLKTRILRKNPFQQCEKLMSLVSIKNGFGNMDTKLGFCLKEFSYIARSEIKIGTVLNNIFICYENNMIPKCMAAYTLMGYVITPLMENYFNLINKVVFMNTNTVLYERKEIVLNESTK